MRRETGLSWEGSGWSVVVFVSMTVSLENGARASSSDSGCVVAVTLPSLAFEILSGIDITPRLVVTSAEFFWQSKIRTFTRFHEGGKLFRKKNPWHL